MPRRRAVRATHAPSLRRVSPARDPRRLDIPAGLPHTPSVGGVRGSIVLLCLAAALVGAGSTSEGTSAGTIVFDGTWEGTNPTAGWAGIHQGGGTYTFLRDPSRRGTVARVTLPAGGVSGIEAIYHRNLQLGETTVYGFAFKFPAEWRKPADSWCLIAQLAYPLLKYTNIGLGVGENYLGLEMHTGFINWRGKTPSADNPATFDLYLPQRNPRGYVIPPRRFATGVWHLLVIEIEWATGPTGSLRAWHQVQGDKTWVKTVDMEGIPTMQWGQGITGAYMDANGKDRAGEPKEISDKVGAYRDASPNPLTVYNDGMLIGTTPDVVAARLQGTPFYPVIAAGPLPSARTGTRYRAQLAAAGGVLPMRWSISAGALPPGIRLDPKTGALRGRARSSGRFRFAVRLADSTGATVTRSFSLRVVA